MNERASGILLHPTSLPGDYGIGTLGKSAFSFIDFLEQSRQSYWQILPLGPTGYADSPYQCFSAHAGNPNLISLEELVKEKWLSQSDLVGLPDFDPDSVDFGLIQETRLPLLQKAFAVFRDRADQTTKLKYRNFLKETYSWLEDFALYMAIKSHYENKPWYQWDTDVKKRDPDVLKRYQDQLKEEIAFHKFLQYQFFRQWNAVKEYAHKKNVLIIGDIPLYIALDSADAWSNTGIFEFDEELNPIRVGGVPPDYFSETGQLWGNPLFRWQDARDTVYSWWEERIRTNLALFDIIRIDHFRGFAAYWAVPYGETTAIKGTWVTGPGKDFFHAMTQRFDHLPIIAEDLGVITPDVEDLRDSFGFPGMKILEFAFDSKEANDYLPYNFPRNCLVYTGTHDNDTVNGWFAAASDEDRQFAMDYLGISCDSIHWELIRLAMASVANTAVIPMQDLLGLGSEGRMNIPGTTSDNWKWRAREEDFSEGLADRLARMSALYGRNRKRG